MITSANTTRSAARSARGQRGVSLFGLVFWAVVVALVCLMGLRVWPSLNEYFTIKQAVDRIMHSDPVPTNAAAVRKAFDRQKEIEYSISTISGADLEIEQQADSGLRVNYAYDKEIEIVSPVFLLIKYRGSNR